MRTVPLPTWTVCLSACAISPPPVAEPAPAVIVVAPQQQEAQPPPALNEPAPTPTVSGLRYVDEPESERLTVEDQVVGSGQEVQSGDKVTVHYVGRLLDGTEFDNSLRRNMPAQFPLGRGALIKGWELGLVGMRVGGRRRLVIPPSMAYGERGHPPVIPESATLEFEIELISIP